MPQVDDTTGPRVPDGMPRVAITALGEQATRAEAAAAEVRRLTGEPGPETHRRGDVSRRLRISEGRTA